MPRCSSHWKTSGTITVAALALGFEMMPTVLISGIEEEFLVPFRPRDGAFDDAGTESELLHSAFYPLTGSLMLDRVAHNAAFADLALAGFELRFDQYNQLRDRGAKQRLQRGQDQGHRDEADIDDDEIHWLANLLLLQMARVDSFMHDDARVIAESPIELPGSDIDGVDAQRSV